MSQVELTKIVKRIIDSLKNDLISDYGLTSSEIDKLIKDSDIERRIRKYPDVFMHMTKSQRLDCIL
ncbi:MAG: hypothetical protein IJI66_02635 [Erysipelotrichaceae bacterium]|nr:hypothetical protein [Erysipelotrichaceae bacterium]